MKSTRKLQSFVGVGAGQTATCHCQLGLTFHQILIDYAGVTLAQIDAIRVIANGEPIWTITEAAKLDAINQFEGRAAANGTLVLDFNRFGLRTRIAEEITALGTGFAGDPRPVSTLSIEVDINAAAVGTTLSARAVQSAPTPSGEIKLIREFIYNAPAVGVFEISDLPKGATIQKVYFGTGNVNSIRVERDNFTLFDRTKAQNELVQSDGVRVPQAGYVVFDPSEEGHGSEGLITSGVHDLRFVLDMSAPGTVPVTVEYITTLAR